jgi:hypothetical protein
MTKARRIGGPFFWRAFCWRALRDPWRRFTSWRRRRARIRAVRAFALLLLTVAMPLHAEVREGGVRATSDYLARMDVDGDRRVSLREYQDWLSYAFDAMDRNQDAVLTPDELPGGRGKPVTRDVHRERLADTFRKQDANRDGFLDARELSAPPR